MNESTDARLETARAVLTELLYLPFLARERGLGTDERDAAEARCWSQLKSALAVEDYCTLCGNTQSTCDCCS